MIDKNDLRRRLVADRATPELWRRLRAATTARAEAQETPRAA